jgi:hypothetical protein
MTHAVASRYISLKPMHAKRLNGGTLSRTENATRSPQRPAVPVAPKATYATHKIFPSLQCDSYYSCYLASIAFDDLRMEWRDRGFTTPSRNSPEGVKELMKICQRVND